MQLLCSRGAVPRFQVSSGKHGHCSNTYNLAIVKPLSLGSATYTGNQFCSSRVLHITDV